MGTIPRTARSSAFAALALVAAACGQADPPKTVTLFSTTSESGGSSTPNTLISVSWRSGAQAVAGPAGATPEQYALDWNPVTGDLYGVSPFLHPGLVTRISPASGEATVVTAFDAPLMALAFAPDGRLFAVAGTLLLVTLDLEGGTMTTIGVVPEGELVNGIDFDERGALLAVVQHPSAPLQSIATLDTVTAAVTSSVALDAYTIGDIACAPDGFVYGTNFSWSLVRIDPRTGAQANVGFGALGSLGGLAAVPDPPR